MFQENQQIGGYTLTRRVGRGGFGEVWLAEKRSQFISRKVAIKLPLEEQINFEAIKQEASLWEKASGHINVLPIIDADICDGQVIIVSEYAEGGSLDEKIRAEGKFTTEKAIEMTIGILNGLDYLHNQKIIHRDIKPQNVLLQNEAPRLADFGISRAMEGTSHSITISGTDAYMAPEAFDGKRNIQTDIWSVGVVLYQLLSAQLPFRQVNPHERMFAILTKDYESLPSNIPEKIKEIVYKALSKSPERRYQSAKEMQKELEKELIFIKHPTDAPTKTFKNSHISPNLYNQIVKESLETESLTLAHPENTQLSPIMPDDIDKQFFEPVSKELPTAAQKLIHKKSVSNSESSKFIEDYGTGIVIFLTLLIVLLLVGVFFDS